MHQRTLAEKGKPRILEPVGEAQKTRQTLTSLVAFMLSLKKHNVFSF